ncbi:MAG TPA: bifunctional diaminohydroxyphosphoribosylaminopyrimidine deaminase/5-amino-6-(5-phosphoribosylamino)uracil reductase RibD [Steroidobacteraceae bacterium]|nr:bifunctional diaminohydroxyphosphoribosylaminopyrimidine deaminase/5-amino-6-(5-phosphoribosylamino)uracil reductase RibD [Steroidobacteraceae bacterium]
MSTSFDNDMMARALRLARRGLHITDPNPRVGCVIVRDEEIVGEGSTSPVGGPHAEVNALQAAGDAARGATVYVTLEPCSHHGRTPPCSDALIKAGVKRVVYATGDPNPLVDGGGAKALAAAGVKISSGPMAAQARELNIGFFHRMTNGTPWVTVKMGASIDGKIALANGVSRWITGEEARDDVQRQRARSSAIMTGSGTVLADDPRLTVRAPDIDMRGRQVLRVICDSQLRILASARLFNEPGPILILTTSRDESRIAALKNVGAEVAQVTNDDAGRVDLRSVLKLLATRECNELLVEAGPQLTGRLVQLGLANELLLYMAPTVLGSDAKSMFITPPVETMAARFNFELHDVSRVGKDIRVRLRSAEGA